MTTNSSLGDGKAENKQVHDLSPTITNKHQGREKTLTADKQEEKLAGLQILLPPSPIQTTEDDKWDQAAATLSPMTAPTDDKQRDAKDDDDVEDLPFPEIHIIEDSNVKLCDRNTEGIQKVPLSDLLTNHNDPREFARVNPDGTQEGPGYNFDQDFDRQGAKRRICALYKNLEAYLFSCTLLRK